VTSPAVLRIGSISIPESELRFSFSRSGGPGGQNVNKLSTRATLSFDVAGSPSLTTEQRQGILAALPRRIDRGGVLRINASSHRTQWANRQAATARFLELLTQALTPRKPRRATRVSAAARRRRLAEKREHGERKRTRRARPQSDAE
jgi:ribosome-associated protein